MAGISLKDRMDRAGPLWKAMRPRMEAIITAINELRTLLVTGQNPHKVNDVTNVLTEGAAGGIDDVVDLAQDLITQYEAHIGSTTHHLAADSTNVVTETGVPIEVYTLLNEIKTDYEANRVNVTSHHGAADSTNAVTAADADTKAKAITLANDLKTQLNAHMATVDSVHGAADSTNPVTEDDLVSTSSWEDIAAMADALRTAYEAHRQVTAGSVHSGADSTNTVSATAVGTFATAVYAGLNELKGDFNAHVAEFGTSHAVKDDSNVVSTANASSTNTAIALVNDLKTAYEDHITRVDDFAAIQSLDLDS